MQVITYLNKYGLEKLKEEYSIKVSTSENYTDLYVLNYNQIDSPKNNPIVKECRSLVVGIDSEEKFYVVSAAFDRFFNYGETDYEPDISKLVCHEKIDGSLVSVFNYKGQWLYRTKSMIMPEGNVNNFDMTWKDFIEEALGWEYLKNNLKDTNVTYIFEVIGEYNRVVVKYNDTDSYLLAARDNTTLEYVNPDLKWETPIKFRFSSIEQCMKIVKNLRNLEEGYVAYNEESVPVCKIKSPAYVAAHRIKGEGLSPKRLRELVIMNEQDEYIAVFPEDEEKFKPYIDAWKVGIVNSITAVWGLVRDVETQKEFALKVKNYPFSALLFQARKKNSHPVRELSFQKDSYKMKLIENFMDKNL